MVQLGCDHAGPAPISADKRLGPNGDRAQFL